MITYVVGDLFTSPAKVLVNTVNTVGVMGKGIARDFKRIYPEMFHEYQSYCDNGLFDIGKLWLYKTPHKWILNFPTKKHWRNKSKIEYLEAGLKKFANTYDAKGITSISFPMLGCGNGELDWKREVKPLMEQYLMLLPIEVYVHLYRQEAGQKPEHRDIAEVQEWLRQEPHHLPFSEFWADVVSLATSRITYQRFDNMSNFSITYVKSTDILVLRTSLTVAYLQRESFETFWAAIRPIGYFRFRDFPEETTTVARELATILAELPYISFVEFSRDAEDSNCNAGIQLHAMESHKNVTKLRVNSA